jgi:hypothetical protein
MENVIVLWRLEEETVGTVEVMNTGGISVANLQVVGNLSYGGALHCRGKRQRSHEVNIFTLKNHLKPLLFLISAQQHAEL